MKKFLWCSAIIWCVIFTAPIVASEFPDTDALDPQNFSDWLTLADLLRRKGIDPVVVNWNPIEMACLSLKTEDDQTIYNRCKFQKAYDARQFPSDSQDCNARAIAQYPDILAQEHVAETYVTQSLKGSPKVVSEVVEPVYSMNDVYTLRRSTYVDCMHSQGWQNADDWMQGKRLVAPIVSTPSPVNHAAR